MSFVCLLKQSLHNNSTWFPSSHHPQGLHWMIWHAQNIIYHKGWWILINPHFCGNQDLCGEGLDLVRWSTLGSVLILLSQEQTTRVHHKKASPVGHLKEIQKTIEKAMLNISQTNLGCHLKYLNDCVCFWAVKLRVDIKRTSKEKKNWGSFYAARKEKEYVW